MKCRRALIFVTMICLLAAAGVATAATNDLSATVDRSGISFEARSAYRSLSLRVTGPDQVVERSFAANAQAFFSPSEFNLPDGQYSYEMVLEPTVEGLARKATRSGGVESVREAVTLTGTFNLVGGAIAIEEGPEAQAGPGVAGAPRSNGLVSVAAADQVIPDDLIVQGSACIGLDCVNNESFGFDTIRLKENNTRIKFEDTSVGTFPTTDWQLTANDSASGGANKFSIEDITAARVPFTIRGGAPSDSLFVGSSGRVGLGTSTPVLRLHASFGDSPGLRLEQNSSSGFGAQSWDVVGNEANFFIRDVTNGSKLPFRIIPGAPTSSLHIIANGSVGLGTSSPASPLHVRRTDGTAAVHIEEASSTPAARGLLTLTNNGGSFFTLHNSNASTDWFFTHENNAPNRFLISDGTGVDFALTKTGSLTIAGTLTTGGPTCGGGCDDVLKPGYDLPSIEDHATEMYQKSYLPAVGPTVPEAPINLTETIGGILNELEKAHIYVEQLNRELKELKAQIALLQTKQE